MTWAKTKLDEPKGKFGESHGGEPFNPKFRRVADEIFAESGTRLAHYSGIPTFLTALNDEIDNDNPDFGALQVAIIGMPMDLGVTNRNGSRFGPRAVRTIERIGPYNHAPVHEQRVADIRDVSFQSRYRLELSHEDIERRLHQIVDEVVSGPAICFHHNYGTGQRVSAVRDPQPDGFQPGNHRREILK